MHVLKSLSDRELVSRLRTLVEKEKSLTLEIVSHLAEVARRGLHLGKGYGSLYEYCRGELGYTDASAWRRARAAQAILRCPEAWERLVAGRVTLCSLGRVHAFITPAVLEEICGKSKTEVEWIAARYDAKGVSPDRMRPVMVPKPAGAVQSGAGDGGLRSEVTGERSAKIEFEHKWKIEGVVSKEIKAKLDRCKSLLSRKYPRGVDYETLFNELSELFLEHFDPERKKERRKKREGGQNRRAKKRAKVNASRHIPAREKARVWTRDGGRCAYVGTDGRRCNSTFGLQIDHFPLPFARGGPSKVGNLRLLCARHNLYTARQVFGRLCDEHHAAHAKNEKRTAPFTHRRE